ncbi:MAG: GNAT family N-acetyltransferase [Phycisphaerae bacterium]
MPLLTPRRTQPVRLDSFDPTHVERVLSWVGSEHEAFRIAPRTPPPLTTDGILRWGRVAGCTALQLVIVGEYVPVAYGEVNQLFSNRDEYWLGHLIVDPTRRGEGFGFELTRLLLHRAFARLGATRVSLVVFPDNERAISVYKAAGMYCEGHEAQTFDSRGGLVERLLRMAISRDDWYTS